jgi:hypothetical protein
MNPIPRFARGRRVRLFLAAMGALSVLFAVMPASAADMDASAKVLAKLDDEWSAAAATRDVDRVASFYADDAVAYPPNEPVANGRAAAK